MNPAGREEDQGSARAKCTEPGTCEGQRAGAPQLQNVVTESEAREVREDAAATWQQKEDTGSMGLPGCCAPRAVGGAVLA